MKNKKLHIEVTHATTWKRAVNFARATVGKEPIDKEPSEEWESRMLLCEHSPIRTKEYDIRISNIKTWVTVHLVRHWLGFIPFIHSQRDDRRKNPVPRDEMPQGSLNDGAFSVNAQALINISRRRLCSTSSPETRAAWNEVKQKIGEIDHVMAEKMVPECIYRGFCPEKNSCGFVKSEKYRIEREKYISS